MIRERTCEVAADHAASARPHDRPGRGSPRERVAEPKLAAGRTVIDVEFIGEVTLSTGLEFAGMEVGGLSGSFSSSLTTTSIPRTQFIALTLEVREVG